MNNRSYYERDLYSSHDATTTFKSRSQNYEECIQRARNIERHFLQSSKYEYIRIENIRTLCTSYDCNLKVIAHKHISFARKIYQIYICAYILKPKDILYRV